MNPTEEALRLASKFVFYLPTMEEAMIINVALPELDCAKTRFNYFCLLNFVIIFSSSLNKIFRNKYFMATFWVMQ